MSLKEELKALNDSLKDLKERLKEPKDLKDVKEPKSQMVIHKPESVYTPITTIMKTYHIYSTENLKDIKNCVSSSSDSSSSSDDDKTYRNKIDPQFQSLCPLCHKVDKNGLSADHVQLTALAYLKVHFPGLFVWTLKSDPFTSMNLSKCHIKDLSKFDRNALSLESFRLNWTEPDYIVRMFIVFDQKTEEYTIYKSKPTLKFRARTQWIRYIFSPTALDFKANPMVYLTEFPAEIIQDFNRFIIYFDR